MTAVDRKTFLLRIDAAVWAELEQLARADLRSVNAEVEFLLRDALARRGCNLKPRNKPRGKPRRQRETLRPSAPGSPRTR